MPITLRTSIAAIAALIALAGRALALTPDQVAVVVNTQSEGSKMVARAYMEARNIPAENLLEITVDPMLRGWSEPRYRDAVVGPIRKQLIAKKIDQKVTCIVLTYDVPLTVPSSGVGDGDKVEYGAYEKRLRDYYGMLVTAAEDYDTVAAETQPAAPATRPQKVPTPQELRAAQEKLIEIANSAVKRIEKMPADIRGAQMERFSNVHLKYLGPAGVIAVISGGDSTPAAIETRKKIEAMREEVSANNKKISELASAASTAKVREELLALRAKTYGIVGGANQTLDFVQRMNPVDSSSCLDNELALLWHDDYPKSRWVDNPYMLSNWPAVKDRKVPRVMMIARVDGVTPQGAIAMINTTIKIEKEGLDGVAYFDARGIENPSYKPYDIDLMATADYLSKNSAMKVVLDKQEQLLQAANCPDAAVYCGWYSLRNYQDSCKWKPGAVGFHVASWEMMALHDDREKGWVANLLKRGFCGTLGATDEPYLLAFPKPSYFFPLLLSGEFTQGEIFLVTQPWLSWRIGYVSDPLYNPFKAKPMLDPAKLKESRELARAYEILGTLGMGPGK